ncbi:MAG TPA: ribosome maturation factor RimP [Acidimicrobiia bacterium]
MQETTEIWGVVEAYLTGEGLELDDLEVLGSGRGRRVRVIVDSERGVDIQLIAELSRRLGRVLEDMIQGDYTLEVSSPGLERSLKRPAHYRKAVGRDVLVKARDPQGGVQVHRGRLASAEPSELVLELDSGSVIIPMQSVASARTVYEMQPVPKPGKRR